MSSLAAYYSDSLLLKAVLVLGSAGMMLGGDMAANSRCIRVFISSTYLDSQQRRGLVRGAIERQKRQRALVFRFGRELLPSLFDFLDQCTFLGQHRSILGGEHLVR